MFTDLSCKVLFKFLFINPIYAPETAKFWALTDSKHSRSFANKNMSSSFYKFFTESTYPQADNGLASFIVPWRVPDFGLNPIDEE